MTSPASNNKAPYRGVASRPNSWVHGFTGGWGDIQYLIHYQKQRYTFQIFFSESRVYDKQQTLSIIREITDINLETRRNSLKSGDYRPKPGDWEIQLKIWRHPDYPGELTALL